MNFVEVDCCYGNGNAKYVHLNSILSLILTNLCLINNKKCKNTLANIKVIYKKTTGTVLCQSLIFRPFSIAVIMVN